MTDFDWTATAPDRRFAIGGDAFEEWSAPMSESMEIVFWNPAKETWSALVDRCIGRVDASGWPTRDAVTP